MVWRVSCLAIVLPRRWARQVLGLLALALVCGLLLSPLAWTTSIIAPARPRDPVTVYLIDQGHTSSLILPTADGGMVRYAYGNWKYYALSQRRVRTALRALFWPSPATLGRMKITGTADLGNIEQRFSMGTQFIYPILVERQAALALVGRLDRRYAANLKTEVINREHALNFVHDPDSYRLSHNSNQTTAAWLRELGCEVHGPALYSKWRVKRARGGVVAGADNAKYADKNINNYQALARFTGGGPAYFGAVSSRDFDPKARWL